MNLNPWRLSGILTSTRTVGEIAVRRNGDFFNIWVRVAGKNQCFSVLQGELSRFVHDEEREEVLLWAESDGNAEPVSPPARRRWSSAVGASAVNQHDLVWILDEKSEDGIAFRRECRRCGARGGGVGFTSTTVADRWFRGDLPRNELWNAREHPENYDPPGPCGDQ